MNSVFNNFVVVGAGGIGHFLAPVLAKYLSFKHPGSKLTIVDGDKIEDKNLARVYEVSAVGEMKAHVLASTCINLIPRDSLTVETVDEYITPDTYERYHRKWCVDGTVIFGCVDNNKTRVYLESLVKKLNNGIFVVGGNSYHEGQAQLYVRLDGKNITPPITEFAPELLDESDPLNVFPDEKDCTTEYESEPQLILVNMTVASTMLNLFYSQCVDSTPTAMSFNEALVDIIRGGGIAPHVRKSLTKAKI